ncbi:MAG: entericidin A/B family lipoprotein [Pseudomonadota bacterium]
MKRTGFAILAVLAVLGGCSTVAGVGKDVSAVGRGITHVADEVRDEVFTRRDQPRYVETRYTSQSSQRPSVVVKEPCDPNAGELRGGSDLPPCPRVYYRQ